MRRYHRLTFTLPAEQEDLLCAELWALGSIGLECREDDAAMVIEAYFEEPLPEALVDGSALGLGRATHLLRTEPVPNTDWLAVYRSSAQAFEVGQHWVVDPSEPDGRVEAMPGRVMLAIPARRAFGTGSHESTRLILEWLEDLPMASHRVLDLGTGSGILALAAGHLGAAIVVGIDLDPVAVMVARDNRRLNCGVFHLVAGGLDCLSRCGFDTALVNILPSEWVAAASDLAALLVPGGTAIFSGILAGQSDAFAGAVEPAGFVIEAQRQAGEWVALRGRRDD